MSTIVAGCEERDLDEALAHCRPALVELEGASILITGGTGFFGTWLLALLTHARHLLDLKLEVAVLTRDPETFEGEQPWLTAQPFIRLIRGDVRYFEFPKGRFTHVVHAATDTSAAADRDPAALIDSIVGGTRRVLDFAVATGVTRLLYLSSGAVYGPPPDEADIDETHLGGCDPLDPRSAYGQAKRLAEQMCICAATGTAIEPVIARVFACVGPGLPLDGHFAIGNFIRDAVQGRSIAVTGDGRPLRSYLYVGDLVAWLVTLLVRGTPSNAYNVGSDDAICIGDLAYRISALLPRAQGVDVKSGASSGAPRSRYVPVIEKARRELALDVWTPLDEAIRRTAKHAEVGPPRSVVRPHANEHGEHLTFVVDVDGVVASLVPGNDYAQAEPLAATIAAINRLHARGHRIIMFTARGSATGIDWSDLTRRQLELWGLSFHDLQFGKPAADYYIDDRLLSIDRLIALARE
ncbi:MAG: NAD-dependent epimerase/dehydratase family protein [Janthinobacterium lividum]